MAEPVTITKDVTFWYVVEQALSLAKEHCGLESREVVDGCMREVSAAIDAHKEATK
jgi:hypothetical protein